MRSPDQAGMALERPFTGACLEMLPLNEMLSAWPVSDPGGAQSSAPKTLSWSLSRLDGIPPTVAEMPFAARMPRRRVTESCAMPEVCRPSGLVLSSVCRSLARRPTWYEKL